MQYQSALTYFGLPPALAQSHIVALTSLFCAANGQFRFQPTGAKSPIPCVDVLLFSSATEPSSEACDVPVAVCRNVRVSRVEDLPNLLRFLDAFIKETGAETEKGSHDTCVFSGAEAPLPAANLMLLFAKFPNIFWSAMALHKEFGTTYCSGLDGSIKAFRERLVFRCLFAGDPHAPCCCPGLH
jgi:hypothetical protein